MLTHYLKVLDNKFVEHQNNIPSRTHCPSPRIFNMTELSLKLMIWLTYQLGATFAFGVPLILLLWGIINKEYSVTRLLSIYWKISSLFGISILLLTGSRPVGFLTTFASPILILISIWFWRDLNQELVEISPRNKLVFSVKIWRWALSCFCILFASLSFTSLSCFKSISNLNCYSWIEAPINFHIVTQKSFNFLFGANWTTGLAAFIGYVGLIAYLIGLLQWILIRMPKQGRIAGGF